MFRIEVVSSSNLDPKNTVGFFRCFFRPSANPGIKFLLQNRTRPLPFTPCPVLSLLPVLSLEFAQQILDVRD